MPKRQHNYNGKKLEQRICLKIRDVKELIFKAFISLNLALLKPSKERLQGMKR